MKTSRSGEHGRRHLPARQRVVPHPARRTQAPCGVEDAKGQPPSIPFWFGEAPSRTDELSISSSRLREEIESRLDEHTLSGDTTRSAAYPWLTEEVGIGEVAADQLVSTIWLRHMPRWARCPRRRT